MEYTSINIQGNIISSEILDKIRNEEIKHQHAADFGLDRKTSVRDEIGIAWAAARAHWTAFSLRVDRLKEGDSGATETRNSWMIPLLRELGYNAEKASTYIHPDTHKTYAISHKAANLDGFPIHIMGINDDLDKRRETGGPRLSPHALTQEYLNNTEHTYALVSNGRYLRLLRDATRLVRLSYLEFDLEKMMEEELYSDFAILFRLLHATRMPKSPDHLEESFIEYYHLESLASGSRIREKLSSAVEKSIKELANGFLTHSSNEELRESVKKGGLPASDYYLHLLRLIYRVLFLIVTEERNLVYPDTRDADIQKKRKIYYDFYSIERLRKLAAKLHYVDGRKHDLWEGLKATFLLFEKGYYGERLGIKPLGSGLFSIDALGNLLNQKLDNETLLKVVRHLTLFENEQRQWVRVNYSDLDVEEFGSVYEGLLEYDAAFKDVNGQPTFTFVEGTGRSSSGSHYTPEELVKPLIKHSLEYIIEDKLKAANKEGALLSIKVCDVACGSGHILLSAARKIATELASVRTNEDQPSPTALRQAIRDVIKNCIYGVDKNPLAVELCKVALWLEAHNPGEPLNFLDHHIKCGDAIVGLAHKEELQNGIAEEIFKALPGDDKKIASAFAKQNKKERNEREQIAFDFEKSINTGLDDILKAFNAFNSLPEHEPEEIEAKQIAYDRLIHSDALNRLKILSDIQIMQFFLPKTEENENYLITDAAFFHYLRGEAKMSFPLEVKAVEVANKHRFFHWFLEFPEVFMQGGFDCVLGNPPFLGGQKLSGNFGNDYLEYIKYQHAPIGAVDLVTYFFRRIFEIIRQNGFQSLISTNTIAQGKAREDGLDVIVKKGGAINHAVRSIKWPGKAAVEVSLVTISKQPWKGKFILNGKAVKIITPYLDDSETIGNPFSLKQNHNKGFMGSVVLGKGFVLEPSEAQNLIKKTPKNKDVLFPYLIGEDLNNNPEQNPSRWVINFFDWPLSRIEKKDWDDYDAETQENIIKKGIYASPDYKENVATDFPDCLAIVESLVKPERQREGNKMGREKWWQYYRRGVDLYLAIARFERVVSVAQVSKTVAFAFVPTNQVLSMMCIVFAFDDYKSFSTLQNTIHKEWIHKYGSALKSDIRYTPSDVYETFPFPQNLTEEQEQGLERIGEAYHEYRRQVMLNIQLGLTRTYNLFHSPELRPITLVEETMDDKAFEKQFGKEVARLRKHLANKPGTISFNEAVAGILKLRDLHVEMDQAVLEAYGWSDIELRHDFYEVDYLSENDRIRFTIHSDARKEVLKRLLEMNYKIHVEEVRAEAAGSKATKGVSKKGKKEESEKQIKLL